MCRWSAPMTRPIPSERTNDDAKSNSQATGSILNRRRVLKRMAATGVGVVGAGSLLSQSSGTAKAEESHCPPTAESCDGDAITKVYNDGAETNIRYDHALGVAYHGAEDFGRGTGYLHMFSFLGTGTAYHQYKDQEWETNNLAGLEKAGFRVSSDYPIVAATQDEHLSAAGVPSDEAIDEEDVTIEGATALAELAIGYVSGGAGYALTGGQVASSLTPFDVDLSGENSNFSREWDVSSIQSGPRNQSHLTHYGKMWLQIPTDRTGAGDTVSFESYSIPSDGTYETTTEVKMTVENPSPPGGIQ